VENNEEIVNVEEHMAAKNEHILVTKQSWEVISRNG